MRAVFALVLGVVMGGAGGWVSPPAASGAGCRKLCRATIATCLDSVPPATSCRGLPRRERRACRAGIRQARRACRTEAIAGCQAVAGDACPPPTTVPSTTTTTIAPVGFHVVTPAVEIQPGQEITYCYYFRTPDTEAIAVDRWSSTMPSVLHDATVFRTTSDVQPPGTQAADGCGAGTGGAGGPPRWVYAADSTASELILPGDDGTGQPMAMEMPAATPLFVAMHFVNATGAAVTGQLTLDAHGLPAGVPFTPTASFVTFNGNLSLPPNSVNRVESQTCQVPAGSTFWRITTRSHKQSVRTRVLDGATTLFESTDWEHPGATAIAAPPFLTFASNALTYECTYDNPTNRTITTGSSYVTDEECIAIAYFFPAADSLLCVNGFGPLSAPAGGGGR